MRNVPNWKSLEAGDRIRLLCVPAADVKQCEQELCDGVEMAGWTADSIEQVIASNPIVIIDHVDEYEVPWYKRELTAEDGKIEYHSLTITDDDSWEYATLN